jgi:hypothetical protein
MLPEPTTARHLRIICRSALLDRIYEMKQSLYPRGFVINTRGQRMKFSLKLAGVSLAAAILTACGGGGGSDQVDVVAADATLAASATTTGAVAGATFAFGSGVADFGTTGTATTLGFSSGSGWSVSAGGATASGTTTYGSCIFAVTQSTFPASSPLATGKIVLVHPCDLVADIGGQAANGLGTSSNIALKLGTTVSAGTPVTVAVSATGQITINGVSVGSVTLAPVTGGA